MTMEQGGDRPGDGTEGQDAENSESWYFDLPNGAWERQEAKNRELRQRVHENIDEVPERPDPFVRRAEPEKKGGFFGLGRRKGDPDEPRQTSGGTFRLAPGGDGASFGNLPLRPAADDDEWSTEPELPEPLHPAPSHPAHQEDEPATPLVPLRFERAEPDEAATESRWDAAFGLGDSDEGGLAAMRDWAKKKDEAEEPKTFVVHVEPDEHTEAEPPAAELQEPAGATEPAPDVPAAAVADAPEIERPTLGFVRHAHVETEPDEASVGGEDSRWNQLFKGAEETGSGGLAAMAEWAKKKDVPADASTDEIPEEFLKPFDWEQDVAADASAAGEEPAAELLQPFPWEVEAPGGAVNAPGDVDVEAADAIASIAPETERSVESMTEAVLDTPRDEVAAPPEIAEEPRKKKGVFGRLFGRGKRHEPVPEERLVEPGESDWAPVEDETASPVDADPTGDERSANPFATLTETGWSSEPGTLETAFEEVSTASSDDGSGWSLFEAAAEDSTDVPVVASLSETPESDAVGVDEGIVVEAPMEDAPAKLWSWNAAQADSEDIQPTATPAEAEPEVLGVSVGDVEPASALWAWQEQATAVADTGLAESVADADDQESLDEQGDDVAPASMWEPGPTASDGVLDAYGNDRAWMPDTETPTNVVPEPVAEPDADGWNPEPFESYWSAEPSPEAAESSLTGVTDQGTVISMANRDSDGMEGAPDIADAGAPVVEDVFDGPKADLDGPAEVEVDAEATPTLAVQAENKDNWASVVEATPTAENDAQLIIAEAAEHDEWSIEDDGTHGAVAEDDAEVVIADAAEHDEWSIEDEGTHGAVAEDDAEVVIADAAEHDEWPIEDQGPHGAIADDDAAVVIAEAAEHDEWSIEDGGPHGAVAEDDAQLVIAEAAEHHEWSIEDEGTHGAVAEDDAQLVIADAAEHDEWSIDGDLGGIANESEDDAVREAAQVPIGAQPFGVSTAEPEAEPSAAATLDEQSADDAPETADQDDSADDPWAAFMATRENVDEPAVEAAGELRWDDVFAATSDTEQRDDGGADDASPSLPESIVAEDAEEPDDPWASIAAASGYDRVSPSGVALYHDTGEPDDAVAASLESQMAEAAEMAPEAEDVLEREPAQPSAWASLAVPEPEEPLADSGWQGEDDGGAPDDVILRAFERHAAGGEASDLPRGDESEELDDAAFGSLLGDDAEELVSDSGPLDDVMPFQRLQGWAPQRAAHKPAEPSEPWQPDGQGAFGAGEAHDPTAPLPWRNNDDILPPPPWPSGGNAAPEPERALVVAGGHTRTKTLVRELVETGLLALLVFLAVRASFQNFKVDGTSMSPTLADGQFLIVNKLVYSEVNVEKLSSFIPFLDAGTEPTRNVFHGPERGDIVVLVDPNPRMADTDLIKRIIGLPGESVEIAGGHVYINDHLLEEPYIKQEWAGDDKPKIVIPADMYYVLGDNRTNSLDSRSAQVGLVPKNYIIGKAMLSYWPKEKFGLAPNEEGSLTDQGPPRLTAQMIGDAPSGSNP